MADKTKYVPDGLGGVTGVVYHDNGDGTYSQAVYAGAGGGAATIADGADVTQGAKADSVATTDTGTFTEIALIKRQLQKLTLIVAALAGAGELGVLLSTLHTDLVNIDDKLALGNLKLDQIVINTTPP